jgi:hypothetical protein
MIEDRGFSSMPIGPEFLDAAAVERSPLMPPYRWNLPDDTHAAEWWQFMAILPAERSGLEPVELPPDLSNGAVEVRAGLVPQHDKLTGARHTAPGGHASRRASHLDRRTLSVPSGNSNLVPTSVSDLPYAWRLLPRPQPRQASARRRQPRRPYKERPRRGLTPGQRGFEHGPANIAHCRQTIVPSGAEWVACGQAWIEGKRRRQARCLSRGEA